MKKAFFINGGAGRVLCAIPALEHYKKHIDPDVVVVSEGWDELYMTSSIRNNVFNVNHKQLFEDKLKDKELLTLEPYRMNAYFNQKCNLIQAFDMLINEDKDNIPETKNFNLEISRHDQAYGYNLVQQVKQQAGKDKVVVFQPLGSGAKLEGEFVIDDSGRSFDVKDIIEITKELSKHAAVIMMTNIKIPVSQQMSAAIPEANILQWMGIIKMCDYFLGCDSMGQHYAHALNKPATVVIGSTYPENISYPDNKDFTIIDNGKDKGRVYNPFRIQMDWDANRNNEDMMVMDDKQVKNIIDSVLNKVGRAKKVETVKAETAIPLLQKSQTPVQFPLANKTKSKKAKR